MTLASHFKTISPKKNDFHIKITQWDKAQYTSMFSIKFIVICEALSREFRVNLPWESCMLMTRL